MNASGERENILGRIREALSVLAPEPGTHDHTSHQPAGATPAMLEKKTDVSRWLPAVGLDFDSMIAAFRANAMDLRADFRLLDSRAALPVELLKISREEGWKKVGTHRGELTDAACAALSLPICRTDSTYNVTELESCDAGVTQCDALIAQTGSVFVTSRSAGGRGLSILPPHHIVLARREQLVSDLPSAFALIKTKYAPDYPSMISLVTGPSRTGDIERILVLGAHGPKKLTILCA
jgi:L-lactate dehydrogenase complex protein LldG